VGQHEVVCTYVCAEFRGPTQLAPSTGTAKEKRLLGYFHHQLRTTHSILFKSPEAPDLQGQSRFKPRLTSDAVVPPLLYGRDLGGSFPGMASLYPSCSCYQPHPTLPKPASISPAISRSPGLNSCQSQMALPPGSIWVFILAQ
jgi:hypothetical protein